MTHPTGMRNHLRRNRWGLALARGPEASRRGLLSGSTEQGPPHLAAV